MKRMTGLGVPQVVGYPFLVAVVKLTGVMLCHLGGILCICSHYHVRVSMLLDDAKVLQTIFHWRLHHEQIVPSIHPSHE